MKIALFTIFTCVVLIAVMVAVAYVCNRLNIGTRTTAQQAPLPLTSQSWLISRRLWSVWQTITTPAASAALVTCPSTWHRG